jgi:Domain of unknown function (DUF4349)
MKRRCAVTETTGRYSWKKRVLLIVGGAVVFLLVFVFAIRITVSEMFRGIASQKAAGLEAVADWDLRSMWSTGAAHSLNRSDAVRESWIARSAELQVHSALFEHSVSALHGIVAGRHGYLEDLRTESRTGAGRALAATISVPTEEFDGTVSDLQKLGRVESVSQAGEDSAVKLATAKRRLEATKMNLARLQKLQRERKGELRDAVALEKDIAQANETVAEEERQSEALISTVAQAHIRVALFEDYRAPLQISVAGAFLQIRNSIVEGTGTIFSSLFSVLGILFGYGLPLVFWWVVLFWPVRMAWRRFRRTPVGVVAA